jgi:Ca2+-binding RTX toxin-like protein
VVTGLGRLSTVLDGYVQISDTFLGGDGTDSLRGTAAGEALLLYDPIYSGSNPLLSDQDARLISIEEIDMGAGDDLVNLTSSVSQLGALTDTQIAGGAGDDYLYGGAGNDSILGGTGSDRLIGWKGDDVLTGGTAPGVGDGEEDRFLFAPGAGGGTDRITDFEDGTDTLWIVGYGVDSLDDALAGGVLEIAAGVGHTTLTLMDSLRSTQVVLEGIFEPLDTGDFVFAA